MYSYSIQNDFVYNFHDPACPTTIITLLRYVEFIRLQFGPETPTSSNIGDILRSASLRLAHSAVYNF